MHFDNDHVYLVESPQDDTVHLALAPRIEGDALEWFDTLRPRVKHGVVEHDDEHVLVFRARDGAQYTFRVLTLALYDERVRDVVEGSPVFDSDEALHRYYVERFL